MKSRAPHKTHRLSHRAGNGEAEDPEPGMLPVEPDKGPVQPDIPVDPEHDRVVDPEA